MTTINTQNRVSDIPVAAPGVSGSVQSVGNFGGGIPPAPHVPPAEVEDRPLPFPIEALNRAQRRAVQAVAGAFRQDPGLAGTVSIAGIAGALGRMFQVDVVPEKPTWPNIYAMAVADRGYGKGSATRIIAPITARDQLIRSTYRREQSPLMQVQLQLRKQELRRLMESHNTEGDPLAVESRESQLAILQADIDRLERLLKNPPTLIVGSATGAALIGMLERNDGQLFSFNPEAGDLVRVALGRFTPDRQGDFDLLLSAYSVEGFTESRSTRGTTSLDQPCMTACWMAQPSLLMELLASEEARSRGLLARFLWLAIEQREIPEDDGQSIRIAPSDMQAWETVLNQALEARLGSRSQGPVLLCCQEEARQVFRRYHNETVRQRNGVSREVQAEFGRARENAIKLALGQCVADALETGDQPPTELTVDHARRGVALARFYYDQFMRLLRPAQTEIRLRGLSRLEEICRSNGGSVTLRVLQNSHGLSEQDVIRTVGLFPTRLVIETNAVGPRGGRPSRVLRLLQPGG